MSTHIMFEILLTCKIKSIKCVNIESCNCHFTLFPTVKLIKSTSMVYLHCKIKDSVLHITHGTICFEIEMTIKLDVSRDSVNTVNDNSDNASKSIDISVKNISVKVSLSNNKYKSSIRRDSNRVHSISIVNVFDFRQPIVWINYCLVTVFSIDVCNPLK